MEEFRTSIEGYCQLVVDYDCRTCAFSAACNIAAKDLHPEEMTDREIQIMYNNALSLYAEMGTWLGIDKGNNPNQS